MDRGSGLPGLPNGKRTFEALDDPRAIGDMAWLAVRSKREIGAMVSLLGWIGALVFAGDPDRNLVPAPAGQKDAGP